MEVNLGWLAICPLALEILLLLLPLILRYFIFCVVFFLFFGFIYFLYFQFRMYFPFCPTSEGVAARIAALLGIESGEVLIFFFFFFFFLSPSHIPPPQKVNNIQVKCGELGPARQASAGGLVSLSLDLTSTTIPATALASRLEYLLTTGRAGIAFDTAAGFSSTSGGTPFAGEIPTIEGSPTTIEVTGGGGGGGLSGGEIAGIVVGSVFGAVLLAAAAAAAAVVMKKRGEEEDTYGSDGGSNKGVPVMDIESHQRRVVEGEMASVTERRK